MYFWASSLSYIIIGLNYFLREACIALINWIGYRTETKRLDLGKESYLFLCSTDHLAGAKIKNEDLWEQEEHG